MHEDCIFGEMGSCYGVKMRGDLGPSEKDSKEVDILGRMVSWTGHSIEVRQTGGTPNIS